MKQVRNILAVLNNKERKRFFQHLALNIIISLLDIAFLAILLVFINIFTGNLPAHKLAVLPEATFNQNPLQLFSGFLVLFALKNWAALGLLGLQNKFAYTIATRISEDSLYNYLEGEYTDYVAIDSSVQVRLISNQPIEFVTYVLSGLREVITQVALILCTIVAIIIYNPTLFILLLAFLLPAILLVGIRLKNHSKLLRFEVKCAGAKSIQYMQESLASYVESNIYDKKHFFVYRYKHYQQRLNTFLARQHTIQAMPSRLMEVFALLGFLILLVASGYTAGPINVMTVGVFMLASYKVIPGAVKILNSLGQIKAYEFTVYDILAEKPPVAEPQTTDPQELFLIECNDIGFSFNESKVLENFNMLVERGQFIGVSGESGKGKSTLVNLLLGFLEPQTGSISLNLVHANQLMRKSYRSRIAYVKQQPFIIHDTILKNISLSEERCCERKLEEAVKISGLQNFIDQQPEGLDTIISESGKNISGGQRQRIALARALYKNADLIILDEAFSEVDSESGNGILRSLQDISRNGKMIILISHSLETLSFCDKTLSLNAVE